MAAEAVTVTTPRPVSRAVLTQRWRELAFLHWPADPDRVARLLPPGTRPDLFEGGTYVGLVPFEMHRVAGLPYLGTFCETNVRLYSVDGQGRRGVVFRSLDATRLLPVLTARATLSLPYMWSAMRMRRDDNVITYRCRRRWRGTRSRAVVAVGDPIDEPTPLEHFLTARWGLHVRWHGRTLYMPNEHPRWPLHRAELLDLDDDLVEAAGLPKPQGPPVSVLYSPGVPVRFGAPYSSKVISGGATRNRRVR